MPVFIDVLFRSFIWPPWASTLTVLWPIREGVESWTWGGFLNLSYCLNVLYVTVALALFGKGDFILLLTKKFSLTHVRDTLLILYIYNIIIKLQTFYKNQLSIVQ